MTRRQPLLLLLMLPLVGILTLAVGLVWYITAQRTEATVHRLLQDLSTQQINETKYKLQRQFGALRQVNEHNAFLLSQGVVNRNDAQAVQKLFWSQKQSVRAAGYLLYGTLEGDFVDVGVPLTIARDLVTERISRTEFGDNLLRTYAMGNDGQQQELLSSPMDYPFQKEPWFSDAVHQQATFWTDVYVWESSSANPQAIAVSSPVWGPAGQLVGVVAIEYRLAQLNPLLRSVAPDADTLVVLLSARNLLLASTADPKIPDQAKLHTHPEVARALDNLAPGTSTVIRQVDWYGKRYHVGISRWQTEANMQWPILVAIPMDSQLNELAHNQRTTLLITAGAWLLLLVVGMGLNGWLVNRPIARLAAAVKRASQGELAHDVTIDRVKELAALADNFNTMQKSLHTLHQQLTHTNQTLEQQVAARTQELTQLKEHAEHLARTDPLTGLANRRALAEMADRLLPLAERTQRPLSVMALDIDHFKHVNDTWGHAAGDRVLQALAHTLQANLRACDVVARVGGEEFAVLLTDTSAQEAAMFAERLRETVMAMDIDTSDGTVVHITSSFGISQTQPGHNTLDTLLASADAALYQSKQTGRNRVTVSTQVFDAADSST